MACGRSSLAGGGTAPLRVANRSHEPDQSAVRRELRIAGQQREVVDDTLREQETIERIPEARRRRFASARPGAEAHEIGLGRDMPQSGPVRLGDDLTHERDTPVPVTIDQPPDGDAVRDG
jgi:hypothetical protein